MDSNTSTRPVCTRNDNHAWIYSTCSDQDLEGLINDFDEPHPIWESRNSSKIYGSRGASSHRTEATTKSSQDKNCFGRTPEWRPIRTKYQRSSYGIYKRWNPDCILPRYRIPR
jgi:hypothetical protein